MVLSPPSKAQVELLHWWTSDGEKQALQILKQQLKAQDIQLIHSPVLGGGGDSAMTVLQARALAGNPPSIAQIEGPSIKAWDAIGILHSVNKVAKQHQWDDVLYPLSVEINETPNGYVALPLTLHRMNWLWVNHKLLKQLGLSAPNHWDEMFTAMELAKQHGLIPIAVGDQPWQVAQLFENLVIATGGVDFYTRAMVKLERNSIDNDTLREALRQFRRLSLLMADNPLPDTKWDTATKALGDGKALFQIGGDWILGELMAKEIAVPEEVGCYPTPDSDGVFLYNMDSLVFMSSKSFNAADATRAASALADVGFQTEFSRVKGSIPVRTDIDISDFNPCQIQAYQDFHYGVKHNLAVPSMIDSMAVNPVAQQAINSEIFRFYRNPDIQPDELIRRIIAIAESN
ncbi:ABC transporter substrate-binding protein [Vibrio sp. CAU 1672]|uniref:ABC transporter substrate-binding protein n=1 Tax=Vibrio sp. CAU 1672 TaxID=3032594 RepID=UPI0023DB8BAF|nr:ABC transporter substrate-binding protein [Vibrio sp. CAU 1672]MDF2153070.1 ABC transporter substrate-binding protein [Vibrio sp. CAU 1672]